MTDESRVVFVLGGEEWCLPVAAVREVLPWQRPTRLPDPRPTLRGVVRVRDDVIAVHDAAPLLGVVGGAEGGIVVVEARDRPVGIAVEATREVMPPLPVAPAPAGGATIAGIVVYGDRTIVALDPAELLRALGEQPKATPHARRKSAG